MKKLGLVALVLVLVSGTSGCSMFRAQFGGGIGLGADLKLPGLCHTGLSAGQYMNIGIRYDDPELSHDANATLVAWHWEGRQSRRRDAGRFFICDHGCWGGLPPVTVWNDDDHLSVWDFEVGLNLLVIDVRLGFNPLRFDRGGSRKKAHETPRLPYPERAAPSSSNEPAEPATAPAPTARRSAPTIYPRDPLMPGPVDPPTDAGD